MIDDDERKVVGSPDEYIAAFRTAGLRPVDEEAAIGAIWSDDRITVVLHLQEAEFAGYASFGGPDDDHKAGGQHRFWSPDEIPTVIAEAAAEAEIAPGVRDRLREIIVAIETSTRLLTEPWTRDVPQEVLAHYIAEGLDAGGFRHYLAAGDKGRIARISRELADLRHRLTV